MVIFHCYVSSPEGSISAANDHYLRGNPLGLVHPGLTWSWRTVHYRSPNKLSAFKRSDRDDLRVKKCTNPCTVDANTWFLECPANLCKCSIKSWQWRHEHSCDASSISDFLPNPCVEKQSKQRVPHHPFGLLLLLPESWSPRHHGRRAARVVYLYI